MTDEQKDKIRAEIEAEIAESIRLKKEIDDEIQSRAEELARMPQTISIIDFNYVWYYYDPEHGFYDFFTESGLTKQEVLIAMRCVMNSPLYFGSFDTMCREFTRDILYYMKGIKMPYDPCFKGKYEYQHFLDQLFGF